MRTNAKIKKLQKELFTGLKTRSISDERIGQLCEQIKKETRELYKDEY